MASWSIHGHSEGAGGGDALPCCYWDAAGAQSRHMASGPGLFMLRGAGAGWGREQGALLLAPARRGIATGNPRCWALASNEASRVEIKRCFWELA